MFQKPAASNSSFPQSASTASTHDDVETVVGPSVHVEGDFSSEGNILVKGMVSGSVRTSKVLTAEAGAKIMANVRAGSAIISGEIRGSVKADERLELTSSARILGDIECLVLVVEAGALIVGKITMKGIEDDSKTDRRVSSSRMKPKMMDRPEEEPAL